MTELSQSTIPEASEALPKPHITAPIGTYLFYAGERVTGEPIDDILSDERIQEQAAARRQLYASFDSYFTQVPDPTMAVTDALREGFVDSDIVADMYDKISDFIEEDANNTRIILYLPFELLPDLTDEAIEPQIESSAHRLAQVFRDAWIRQLHEIEPRASFVDGDVLEPGLPDPEEISKAGHLIPEILAKGIISINDVLILMDIIQDPSSIKPMIEGATVARDMHLIDDSAWAQITEISYRKLTGIPLGPVLYDEELFGQVSPERTKWLKSIKEPTQDQNIEPPDLSSPIPVEPDVIEKDFPHLVAAVKKIQEDPLLSSALYPTFLLFGSRVKGYASNNSDYDAALFFKPGIKPEDRNKILTHLFKVAPEVKSIDKLLEYWMVTDNEHFDFDTMNGTPRAMGFEQIHFLIGGMWISQNGEYKQFARDILKQYLDLARFGDQKGTVRSALLGRIELDMLQYRLMHKGYRKYYASLRKQGTQNSNLIDWESDFWDPGYRRIASKLFVSRVFLPDLS